MQRITPHSLNSWQPKISEIQQSQLLMDLEMGKVIFLPRLAFFIDQTNHALLTPAILGKRRKNISYDSRTKHVKGCIDEVNTHQLVQKMMERFSNHAHALVASLFPHYAKQLTVGSTSFRPAEAKGRQAPSYRKNDTRLHIDAFPTTPMGNKRILRLFSNINPDGVPRIWRLGESFQQVVSYFMPSIRKPLPGTRTLMNKIGITREYRTLYDHYMLKLHNRMKKDNEYQQNAAQETVHLPSQSTWLVFTDTASHAAMSGQYLLEQTFYLPVDAMRNEELAPLKILEKHCQQALLV